MTIVPIRSRDDFENVVVDGIDDEAEVAFDELDDLDLVEDADKIFLIT